MAGGPALVELNCTSSPQNTYPRVKLTICWSGAAATYPFLDTTWTNGESKIVCPDNYIVSKEFWIIADAANSDYLHLAAPSFATHQVAVRKGVAPYTSDEWWLKQFNYFFSTFSNTYNIATVGSTFGALPTSATSVAKECFHFLKTNSTPSYGIISVKWEPITGVAKPWASWVATDLVYATTSTSAACP
jgi:hypothetical protein